MRSAARCSPEDFRLDRRPETAELAAAISGAASGVQQVMLGGRPQLVAWTTVAQTGWHLLTVVDEAAVFRQTNALASRYRQIGYLLIAGLVLFYIGFALMAACAPAQPGAADAHRRHRGCSARSAWSLAARAAAGTDP